MSPLDLALAICRALHYAAALTVFGALVFQVTAPPDLWPILAPLGRGTSVGGASLAVVTTLGWLLLQSIEVSDSSAQGFTPTTFGLLLASTDFGHVWQVHLLCAGALTFALILPRRLQRKLLPAIATLYLVGLAFIGHAVMREGPAGWVLRVSHAAHLLAAGFWLGSLPSLLVCIRAISDVAYSAAAIVALKRFSSIGQLAVAVILVTGAANVWLIISTSGRDPDASYATLLGLKVVLVAGMLALAAVNHFVLVPRLDALRRRKLLLASIGSEIALGFAVVAVVSVLGMMSPSR